MIRMRTWAVVAVCLSVVCGDAHAADIGAAGKRLVIRLNNTTGTLRLVSVQKSTAITKGAAGNVASLSGTFEAYYADTPANAASFSLPAPWFRNTSSVAKFKNTSAPGGPTEVRAANVRAGRVARVVAKGLGGINIATPPGAGGVITIFTLVNGVDSSTHRICSRYSVADGSTVTHTVTATGYRLRLLNGVATACPTCADGVQNGSETGVDCGGNDCSGCPDGGGCGDDADCQSGVCLAGICQAPTCADTVQNGVETDVDCGGGVCPACGTGDGCLIAADCQTGFCIGNVCVLPPCANGVQDVGETDVDCGGGTCPACAPGFGCELGSDCTSLVCLANVCQAPTCVDGQQNGDETDTDCGGSCSPCADGSSCIDGGDCASGVCSGNVCQMPTCSDGVQNGSELGVDCGVICPPCSCLTRSECLMFVTSTSSGGNLGGLAGADAICNARAAAAGLVGVYQAWLCDGVQSPASRSVHASIPYRRTDGALIASSWSDLTDGSIANGINRTEFGGDVSATSPFLPWTFVTTSGTCDNETYLSPGSGPCPAFSNCPMNCANNGGNNGWTSNSGFVQGSKGDINSTGGNWTDGVTGLCSTPAERIYCIEQ